MTRRLICLVPSCLSCEQSHMMSKGSTRTFDPAIFEESTWQPWSIMTIVLSSKFIADMRPRSVAHLRSLRLDLVVVSGTRFSHMGTRGAHRSPSCPSHASIWREHVCDLAMNRGEAISNQRRCSSHSLASTSTIGSDVQVCRWVRDLIVDDDTR